MSETRQWRTSSACYGSLGSGGGHDPEMHLCRQHKGASEGCGELLTRKNSSISAEELKKIKKGDKKKINRKLLKGSSGVSLLWEWQPQVYLSQINKFTVWCCVLLWRAFNCKQISLSKHNSTQEGPFHATCTPTPANSSISCTVESNTEVIKSDMHDIALGGSCSVAHHLYRRLHPPHPHPVCVFERDFSERGQCEMQRRYWLALRKSLLLSFHGGEASKPIAC